MYNNIISNKTLFLTKEHHVKVLKVPNQGDLTSQEIIALHKASRSTRRQGSSSPVLVLCRYVQNTDYRISLSEAFTSRDHYFVLCFGQWTFMNCGVTGPDLVTEFMLYWLSIWMCDHLSSGPSIVTWMIT